MDDRVPAHPLPRTYVHIGLQKTGTSYLQSVFWQSQDRLLAQGLAMLPATKRATFRVMLDVRNREPGGLAKLDSRLAALLAEGGRPGAPTRLLLTEESLAPATPEQVRRLVDHLAGTEVHVVLTVRDLARQVPSVWQQKVTARRRYTYEQYLTAVVAQGRRAREFWPSQDVPAVLDRWTAAVPPERVHVVTVPPPGTDPTELLARFCRAVEVDPATLDTAVPRRNTSLGLVQTELLRRVNAELGDRLREREAYRAAGKMYLGKRILAAQGGTPPRTPRRLEAWCRETTEAHIAALKAGGYDVVGSLDDLVPDASLFTDDAQAVTDAEVADAAAKAMASMLAEPRQLRRHGRRPHPAPQQPPSMWRSLARRVRR